MKNPHAYPDDLTLAALRNRCASALLSGIIHYAAATLFLCLVALLDHRDPDLVAFAAVFGAIGVYALVAGSIEFTRYHRLQRRLDDLHS